MMDIRRSDTVIHQTACRVKWTLLEGCKLFISILEESMRRLMRWCSGDFVSWPGCRDLIISSIDPAEWQKVCQLRIDGATPRRRERERKVRGKLSGPFWDWTSLALTDKKKCYKSCVLAFSPTMYLCAPLFFCFVLFKRCVFGVFP